MSWRSLWHSFYIAGLLLLSIGLLATVNDSTSWPFYASGGIDAKSLAANAQREIKWPGEQRDLLPLTVGVRWGDASS